MAGEVDRQGGKRALPGWNYQTRDNGGWVDYSTHNLEMMESCRNVMLDVLGELRKLNALLHCSNFIAIPRKLDQIQRNTKKRATKKKVPNVL